MNRTVQRKIACLHQWLAQRERAPVLWLGRHAVLVAWAGLLMAVLTPPRGFGYGLCWWQTGTGLPCPGCGITRSLSCTLRGLFVESVQYHPFGPFILILFVATAAYSLMPNHWKGGARAFLVDRAMLANTIYLVFVSSFVSFGFLRSLHHWVIRYW